MFLKKSKIVISTILIASMLCSCSLFPSQKTIDNIIPDYDKRLYTIADLIPYTYEEIRNAQALYGRELTEYFDKNKTEEADKLRVTDEEKYDFYIELACRNHNYKIIKERYNSFNETDTATKEQNEIDRKKEYEDYYKVGNAKGSDVIKKYNNGKLQGTPLMSIRVILDSATQSNVNDLTSTLMCEIYKPVVIEKNDYDKLKIGDNINLVVPTAVVYDATSSEVISTETEERNFTYVATDSLLYKDEKREETYYFIAREEGLNDCHRIVDKKGKTIEIYVETKALSFMKSCRVVDANEPFRLMKSVAKDDLYYFNFDKIVERALGGGFLDYKYKDFVYANSIGTDRKGYITALTNYDNLAIDNRFRLTLDKAE